MKGEAFIVPAEYRRALGPGVMASLTLEAQEGGRTGFLPSPEAVFLKEVDR